MLWVVKKTRKCYIRTVNLLAGTSVFVTPNHFMQYITMRYVPATFQHLMPLVLRKGSYCDVHLDAFWYYTKMIELTMLLALTSRNTLVCSSVTKPFPCQACVWLGYSHLTEEASWSWPGVSSSPTTRGQLRQPLSNVDNNGHFARTSKWQLHLSQTCVVLPSRLHGLTSVT